jgi:prepilin peptidase CpaA
MITFPLLANFLLLLTTSVLLSVALTDLKQYKIRNDLIIVLAVLYFSHALVSGRWVQIHWHVAFALVLFALMLYAYAQKLMGGGDLKLLTVAFLWVGPSCAIWLGLLMTVFAGLHTGLAKMGWADVQMVEGRMRIPLGPTVAGALLGTILLGCFNSIG